MLARVNRVTTADDFRAVVRRGRRTSTRAAVYYSLLTEESSPVRFGFIVSRAVGSAVVRNRVRRRLRALAREMVDGGAQGRDVVVRALPPASGFAFDALREDVASAVASRRVTA